MRVLMIAGPGAGKGTQGVRVAARYGVPHIATGDLLRAHVEGSTELGHRVEGLLARGELVPDDVVLEMVRAALEGLPGDGYVLDGVPRTMEQARKLYAVAVELRLTADVALHLRVEEDELLRRLLARAADQGRADDTAEVIAGRLRLYDEVTAPILGWYAQRGILVSVDGMQPPDDVTAMIAEALDEVRRRRQDGPDGRPVDLTGLGEAFGVRP